jgi:hypothetical protein
MFLREAVIGDDVDAIVKLVLSVREDESMSGVCNGSLCVYERQDAAFIQRPLPLTMTLHCRSRVGPWMEVSWRMVNDWMSLSCWCNGV